MAARVNQENADNMGSMPESLLYPFSGDADFALSTGDGILYGLHRALLKRASPVMSAMFSLEDAMPSAASASNVPGEHH
jgi:hypothetical protein